MEEKKMFGLKVIIIIYMCSSAVCGALNDEEVKPMSIKVSDYNASISQTCDVLAVGNFEKKKE